MRGAMVLALLALLAVGPDGRVPTGPAHPSAAARPPSPPLDNAHHLYVLDGHGNVHPVGDAPPLTASVTWPNKDVAYSLALFRDGSGGYVLNAWGGLDAVGEAPAVDTGLTGLGFGVAREVVLAPWASQLDPAGYVLDAYGGLHEFGDAPRVTLGAHFTSPIARGAVLLPSSNPHQVAGYTLGSGGTLYPFGGAPAVAAGAVWPGKDVARGITLAAVGGYVLDEYGALHPFGGAPEVGGVPMWSGDLADSMAAWSLAPASAPGGWILDRHGGIHSYGSAPLVTSDSYWPDWDIARGLGSPGGGGGSRERTLVDPESLSDGWGAYYNQRDARWGRNPMGASPYPVWEFGCLMTDLAMVYTHFGYRYVTPATVAANIAFFYGNAQMDDGALSIPGHAAMINRDPSAAWIAAQVAAGRPVIVGMNLPGGGTHFIVLTGMNGASDYWANDPWDQNGMHVQFTGDWDDRGQIYEAIAYS
jgi:hypothetical protein